MPESTRVFQGALKQSEVEGRAARYVKLQDQGSHVDRADATRDLTTSFYDLVTDFYEFGWGKSFHFAPVAVGEEYTAAITRYEHTVALKAGLYPGARVLDVGCGVGGPMRTIARFSEARVTGVNLNAYQVKRTREHNAKADLAQLCDVVETDFAHMPFADDSFDAAYDFEATCHAVPHRTDVLREVYRVLKPGNLFVTAQWCLTDRYDPNNPGHQRIKHGIEKGNGLADLETQPQALESLRGAGFEVLEARDLAPTGDTSMPWYRPLEANVSLQGFMKTRVGTKLTHYAVRALERVGLSPKGTTEVHRFLLLAQRSLVAGGRAGLFTPMYLAVAKKPMKAN